MHRRKYGTVTGPPDQVEQSHRKTSWSALLGVGGSLALSLLSGCASMPLFQSTPPVWPTTYGRAPVYYYWVRPAQPYVPSVAFAPPAQPYFPPTAPGRSNGGAPDLGGLPPAPRPPIAVPVSMSPPAELPPADISRLRDDAHESVDTGTCVGWWRLCHFF
jgi:hypothetical protein